ncbi:MAG TPA: flagellar basal-body MS-ring/collar protein FliF [bacterium]|nr:flagellar basal-body MS-ring/collar protein FliF [bacterium]
MKERLEKLRDSAVEFWDKLNKQQRIILAAVSGVILLGIVALVIGLIVRGGGPNMENLFTQLEAEDANAIVTELKKTNTPYELSDGGKAILVNKRDVYEKRLELAAKGLPTRGTVGYELFDATQLGITDFTQKVNLRRAVEGELSRTIMGLEAVEQARVMVVQPEPSLFVVSEKEPTASVAIKLREKEVLSEEQVRGIVHLVASSIEGLDPKNVIVVDSEGNILSEFDEKQRLAEKLKLSELQLRHKKLLEDIYQKKIFTALSKVFGEENCVVIVSVELDYDVRETEDEIYSPVVGDSGIVRSEQLIEEKYLGTGTVPEIGVPGTTSNIPGYKGLAEGNAEYVRSEELRNFEITRRIDRAKKNQGDIRRMSVSVMLNDDISYGDDGESYLTRRRITEIRDNVMRAANIDETRGDKVSVIPIKFRPGVDGPKAEYEFNEKMARVKFWTFLGLIIASIIAVLILGIMALRSSVIKEEIPEEPEEDDDYLEEAIPVEELLVPELSDEQRTREKMKDEVLRMINDDPEGAALIVRSWLFQDE